LDLLYVSLYHPLRAYMVDMVVFIAGQNVVILHSVVSINMQVLIFWEFGFKMSIHTPFDP